MKKPIVILLLMIISFLYTSCRGKVEDTKDKKSNPSQTIEEYYKGLKSYEALVKVEVVGNKGKNQYIFKQWYKEGIYKIEGLEPSNIKGKIILFNQQQTLEFLPYLGIVEKHEKYEELQNLFFINEMAKEIVKGSNKKVVQHEEKRYLQYEAKITNTSSYDLYHKLLIDEKTFQPFLYIISKEKEKERIIVYFDNFDYNIELEDEMFEINTM